MTQAKAFVIGLDATNLRSGGGLTHLIEMLGALQPAMFGIQRIVVWGSKSTLVALKSRARLDIRNPPALNGGVLQRILWQRFRLSQAARDEGCDVLLVPGGYYGGNYSPVVTMSRNLLPFAMHELWRYGWSFKALRLLFLRYAQTNSFKRVEGMIFLNGYARKVVTAVTGKLSGESCIIAHGVSSRFARAPKPQLAITEYDDDHPYHVLYVSAIEPYKHQWHVVEAIATLRSQGLPIVLDIVGPSYPTALKRLHTTLERLDPTRRWVHCHGNVAYEALPEYYFEAELSLFASSCENMPNVLLEAMASGLPIACSNRGPMPLVLGEASVYFDPEQPKDIAHALRQLIDSSQLRTELAQASYERSFNYSWTRCANETFAFLAAIVQHHKRVGGKGEEHRTWH